MENAKLNVVKFDSNDVIATSAKTITLSNIGGTVFGDALLTYNGVSYTYEERTTFYPIFGESISGNTLIDNKTSEVALWLQWQDFEKDDNHVGGNANAAYNGTYTWNGTKFIKQ